MRAALAADIISRARDLHISFHRNANVLASLFGLRLKNVFELVNESVTQCNASDDTAISINNSN